MDENDGISPTVLPKINGSSTVGTRAIAYDSLFFILSLMLSISFTNSVGPNVINTGLFSKLLSMLASS